MQIVTALPQAVSAALGPASDLATREDTHAVERAILRLADEVRDLRADLRLVLLSGGKASASDEEEASEPLARPSRRREDETDQEAPRLRRSPARRAAESIRLREQLGTPKAREAARRGALGNADVVPEPDAGTLQRPAAGSDRNGGSAG